MVKNHAQSAQWSFDRVKGLFKSLYAASQRDFAYSLSCGANVVLIRGLGKNVDCGVVDKRQP